MCDYACSFVFFSSFNWKNPMFIWFDEADFNQNYDSSLTRTQHGSYC